jgi:CopG family transcriptional regulator, nickel-responsive regulator
MHKHCNMDDDDLERVGVSLPEPLLLEFDGIIEKRGYGSRSEGIRDAMRMFLSHYPKEAKPDDPIAGIAIAICESRRSDLVTLTELVKPFSDTVSLAFDANVDSERNLKMFVVKGTASRFSELVATLRAHKAVQSVKTVVSVVQ